LVDVPLYNDHPELGSEIDEKLTGTAGSGDREDE
jgi:hypothetical protein